MALTSLPANSPEALRELHAALGAAVARQLIVRLISEGDALISGPHADEGEDYVRSVHNFAGGCSSFGLFTLQAALNVLETALRGNDVQAAQEITARLPSLWQDAKRFISENQ